MVVQLTGAQCPAGAGDRADGIAGHHPPAPRLDRSRFARCRLPPVRRRTPQALAVPRRHGGNRRGACHAPVRQHRSRRSVDPSTGLHDRGRSHVDHATWILQSSRWHHRPPDRVCGADHDGAAARTADLAVVSPPEGVVGRGGVDRNRRAISISRTAFLGVAIGLALILLYWGARRLRDTGVAIVALSTVDSWRSRGCSGPWRSISASAAVEIRVSRHARATTPVAPFVDHSPIWGRGVGTFISPQYRILDNQYLMSVIDTGVLGFVTRSCRCSSSRSSTARNAWSDARAAGDDRFRDIARGLFAAAVVAAVCLATFER